MKKFSVGLTILVMSLFVPVTFAQAQELVAPTGYLEICKNSDANARVSGPFSFTVDGTRNVSVLTGGCSAPIQVAAGNHTVTEASNSFTAVTATDTIPANRLVSSNLATRTDVVSVPAGDVSNTTTVEYTNKALFGTMEICKSAAQGSGLTGSFSFKVTGPMGFERIVRDIPVGACSNSFQVPAGEVEVDEIGDNNTNLVQVFTARAGDLGAVNLAEGRAFVRTREGGVDSESIVTFVNSTSRLKICKQTPDRALEGTVYTFKANDQTVTAVAGPAPGNCVLVSTPFAGGTRVDIQEGIAPGTAVTAIDVSNNRAIAGTTSLNNRSVSVRLGSGETVVTYTNRVAADGLLKVCKNASTGVTVGTVFHFAIGSRTLDVPAGYCAVAGAFQFNSTQTIVEAATPGLAVIGESVDLLDKLVSANLATGTLAVRIGAGVTEATFTNARAGTPVLPGNTSGGTGSNQTGANTPAPNTVPTSNSPGPVHPGGVVQHGRCSSSVMSRVHKLKPVIGLGRARDCGVSARIGYINRRPVIVLRLRGLQSALCKLQSYGRSGHLLSTRTVTVRKSQPKTLRLNSRVARVRVSVVG